MDLDERDVRMRAGNDYDEDEEEEPVRRKHMDDSDDEEEDEEEEEEELERDPRKAKRRRREQVVNPYIDVQALVDDDDADDDEEDEAEAGASFLGQRRHYQQQDDEEDDQDAERSVARARRLDRKRFEDMEISGEELAKRLREKYARNDQMVEELASVPQRMLMPSVNDPNLWQVKVKPGRERDIVLSLYRKTLDLELKGNPLQIISAFERTSIPGYIYVESRSKEAVISACSNLVGIFRRDPILVPIGEMAPLLQLKQKEFTLQPGAWVRLKRGKYQGDLAQVMDVTDTGEEAGIRFLPRIDLTPREFEGGDGSAKRKRAVAATVGRPPARPFNPEEVLKVYGKKTTIRRGPSWIFNGDTYTNGFLEKDVRVSALVTENVQPRLDELSAFLGDGKDGEKAAGGDGALNLASLAAEIRRPIMVALQPGDQVEVYQGEQIGTRGIVDSVLGDIVTIRGEGLELEGKMTIEVPARHVRKRFSPGDHVKVMAGVNTDETGMVLSVNGDLVTFMSDLTESEITVFSKDLRTAAEVGSSSNVVGNYELHDLVQLDMQTVGVIYRTERDSFRVLDQHGQTRLVQPHQITMRKDSRRAVSTDAEGNELRVGDNVKEVDGENRRGVVLHIHQAFYAFLHNREIPKDGGIFVTRCRSLAPIAPKGAPKQPAMDLTKMNPAVAGGTGGAPSMSRGPRDRLIGVNIKIIKGTQKGYQGIIKDVNGQHCRVELSTNNRIITIEKDKLRRLAPNGQLEPLEGPGGFAHPGQKRGGPGGGFNSDGSATNSTFGRTPNPYMTDGGRTPGWGATGRTPNPYSDRRTPAWSANATTPNPYLDSGKTPAWNASSRTPNPYAAGGDGGRTPGWNPASARPTRPQKGGWGSVSDGGGGWGSSNDNDGWSTPRQTGNSGSKGGWGTVKEDSWGADTAPTPAASAPTPYVSAPTPFSAPTPAATAPTPYVSAPTPAVYGETPGGYGIAPTPAGFSAPTPGYTPSNFTAPTPRGIGATPAMAQDYIRIPRDDAPFNMDNRRWLLEFKLEGIQAQIREDADYADEKYAGRIVTISKVWEEKDYLQSTANCFFADGEERGTPLEDVPIETFAPHYPLGGHYQNRKAVLLQNHVVHGRRGPEVAGAKKEIVLLRTYGEHEWLCGRIQVPGAADIEVSATGLCLMGE
ncbi:Transcription elongation factor SPT5 AltName: Full=Chromatin elongation factor SPT5 [Serendipita indica DSM 11827]|nr:Transcription elongation factor SPT5 AltName: Full=Chromatin elongation factor SPT5 [Serendipita indica DSM 11827]